MPPDFLPLDVGNAWLYEVVDARGNPVERFTVEIAEHVILDATSMYVFTSFPLAPDGGFPNPVAIRYDNDRREFMSFNGQREGELFPSLGASAEILESDDGGLPLKARFLFGELALTLERGVGIVEARMERAGGASTTRLVGARVAGVLIGEVEAPEPRPMFPVADAIENVATVTDANPVLEVEALSHPEGHRFVFRIRNTSDLLLGFDFASSQSYDFVVEDAAGGQEVWRWSRRMFFSQVTRSEAIRAGGEWSFEEIWHHTDDELDPVPSGSYRVYGVLTSQPPLESRRVLFQVP